MDNNNFNDPTPDNNQVPNNSYYQNSSNNSGVSNNSLAMAAFILGILAIASVCCIFGSYVFGGIAIILAILSRGAKKKLSSQSLAGIILSTIGMVISTALIIVYVFQFLSLYDNYDEFFDDYKLYYESIYDEEFPFDSDLFNDYNFDEIPEEYYPVQPDNTL